MKVETSPRARPAEPASPEGAGLPAALPPAEAMRATVDRVNLAFASGNAGKADCLDAIELLTMAGRRTDALALAEHAAAKWPRFEPFRQRVVELLLQDGRAIQARDTLVAWPEHKDLVPETKATAPSTVPHVLDPRDASVRSLYLQAHLLLAREDAVLLADLRKLIEEHPYVHHSTSSINNPMAVQPAVMAAVLHAQGHSLEGKARLETIDPPDFHTLFALVQMDRIDDAFDLLAQLPAQMLAHVWRLPCLDRLLAHPRAHELVTRSGCDALRAGGLELAIPAAWTRPAALIALDSAPPSFAQLTERASDLLMASELESMIGRVKGTAGSWIFMPSLREVEHLLRWGLERYPEQSQPLRKMLAQTLCMAGLYAESLAEARKLHTGTTAEARTAHLPLDCETMGIRCIARMFLNPSDESLRTVTGELDEFLDPQTKTGQAATASGRRLLLAVRHIANGLRQGNTDDASTVLDPIDGTHVQEERMMRYYLLRLQRDQLVLARS